VSAVSKLLHIVGSPMEERSFSRRAAEAFVAAYRSAHPGDAIETLDLWTTELPDFDKVCAAGKFKVTRGLPHTPEEAAAWTRVSAMGQHFAAADKYVFSAGMWNFGLPYRLKQYIDIVTQPGIVWDPAAGQGLLGGKRVQLVMASGSRYAEGAANDHQVPYLKTILGFMGLTDIRVLRVMGTGGKPEAAQAALDQVLAEVPAAVRDF
jgi:FMN-dependent NADH-azoreductase